MDEFKVTDVGNEVGNNKTKRIIVSVILFLLVSTGGLFYFSGHNFEGHIWATLLFSAFLGIFAFFLVITQDNKIRITGIMGLLITVSVGSYVLAEIYIYMVAYLWFGFIYGLALQYGRFCFSSAFRDLFAVGVSRMAVGIVIAVVLFGLTVAPVTAIGESTFHPAPWGWHAFIAGLIFGIGMVFAGGCASGSLYKVGEGNGTAIIVVVSISVTQAIFADIGGWTNSLVPNSWKEKALEKAVEKGSIFTEKVIPTDGWLDQYLAGHVWWQPSQTFAQALGLQNDSFLGAFLGNLLVGILIPAAILLVFVYIFWSRKAFLKKWVKENGSKGLKAELVGYWTMLAASKRTAVAGLFLGIAAGLHMLVMKGLRRTFDMENAGQLLEALDYNFGISAQGTVFDPGYWYVTTQEAQLVGWIGNRLGWENMDNIFFGWVNGIPNPVYDTADWMSIALIAGAAVMALLHNEFKWKRPTRELAIWAITGGFLMGIGSRLGLGCNVGGFFVRAANGDISGWIYGFGMMFGAYIGVVFFNWYTERKMAKEMAAFDL
jgi:uncharacterized membrane protein YedE/YeeE